ncbi:hypothetical protein ACTID9_12115 [Brevibacillus fluminis]|uniref:hypothetical protein n=1 Tax=Brevibacillus fluminis TaxID=511487 RepID=UPI003F8C4BCC
MCFIASASSTLVSCQGHKNLEVSYQYDPFGRKIRQTYPDGSEATYVYDTLGRETEESYSNQGETRTVRFLYTDGDRRVTKIMPDGLQEATVYTPYGDIEYQEQHAADGSGTRALVYNVYGTDGRQVTASYPFARVDHQITYRYNEDGSLTEMSDPVGTTEYARANAMQDGQAFLPVQAIQTISPNGKETTAFGNRYGEAEKETNQTEDGSQKLNVAYEQDAFGQLIRKDVTDQTGEKRTWDYRYSPDGQLLYFHDPENNVYQYGYDALGNLITVTENGTVTTQNHYNGLSWKLSEKDVPSGKTETYNYDATGKVTLYKDNAGNSHESGYTPFHDLATYTTRNSAGTIVNKETKTYVPNTSLLANDANSNGADTSYTSPNRREISYSYDPYQRLKEFTAFGRSYEVNQNDADDLMDELVYPDGSRVTYAYDTADRLKEVRSSLTGTVTYDYTIGNDGQTDSVTYPNGYVQEQHQNSFGQVDNLAHKKDGVSV